MNNSNSARKSAVKAIAKRHGLKRAQASTLNDVLRLPAVSGLAIMDDEIAPLMSISPATAISYRPVIESLPKGWRFDVFPQNIGARITDSLVEGTFHIGANNVTVELSEYGYVDEATIMNEMEFLCDDVTEIGNVPLNDVECIYITSSKPQFDAFWENIGGNISSANKQCRWFDVRGKSSRDKVALILSLAEKADNTMFHYTFEG